MLDKFVKIHYMHFTPVGVQGYSEWGSEWKHIHSLKKRHKQSLATQTLTKPIQAREGYFMKSATNLGKCSQEPSKLKRRHEQFAPSPTNRVTQLPPQKV